MRQSHSHKNGYAILELLFYIAFFAMLSIVVINAMIAMSKSFRETEITTGLLRSGNIMESISREVRMAGSINLISANSLKLNTTDSSGNPKTVQFTLNGTNVELYENDVPIGNLNAPNTLISTLLFTEITTANGKAVKIIVSASQNGDPEGRTVDFYDTVVLRGEY